MINSPLSGHVVDAQMARRAWPATNPDRIGRLRLYILVVVVQDSTQMISRATASLTVILRFVSRMSTSTCIGSWSTKANRSDDSDHQSPISDVGVRVCRVQPKTKYLAS